MVALSSHESTRTAFYSPHQKQHNWAPRMLVNGQPQEHLSLRDRAIHYGDGLFETVLVRNSRPSLWDEHLKRLQEGAQALKIPCDIALFRAETQQFLSTQSADGVLKLILSRGEGGRGYTPPEAPEPRRILQFHSLPADYARNAAVGIKAQVIQHPLSINPALAGIKHLNRLDQVMASLELSQDASEGLMCDPQRNLVEGIKSNVFIVENGALITPDLTLCGINGIMRATLLRAAKSSGISVHIGEIPLNRALKAQELFVCNSVMGIWPITQIDNGSDLHGYDIGPITRALINTQTETP